MTRENDKDLVRAYGLKMLSQDGIQLIVVCVDDATVLSELGGADVAEGVRIVVSHEGMPDHVQSEEIDAVDLRVIPLAQHATDALIRGVVQPERVSGAPAPNRGYLRERFPMRR